MSQSAKRIFRDLLLIAALAFALIAGFTFYGGHGLWRALERYSAEALPEHERAERMLDVAVEFKWQVQEWKNLLLRSTSSAEAAQLWEAVLAREQAVRAGLQALRAAGQQHTSDSEAIDAALQAHQTLSQAYEQARQRFEADGFRPQGADALVRGADRPLLAALDAISDRAAERAKLADREAQRSAQQAVRVALVGLMLGLIGGMGIFYVMIRRAVLRPTEQVFTQLAATSELLLQSERMASLGGLVAGVAHEINTPVGVSLTCATTLQKATQEVTLQMEGGGLRKQNLQEYLQVAAECSALLSANAHKVADLVRSFKQVAVDQTSEARRSFAVRAYIEELLVSLRAELKRRPMQIELRCPEGLEMDSYPGAFSQVLTNLLLNAQRHAFDEGTALGVVTIDISQSGEMLEIEFADQGRGIAPEHLGQVFDPFFTTQRHAGGSGLGLNIVYNLITNTLGGQVRLLSQLGQGTKFLISLPRVAPKISSLG
ncbi:HAMP domain-containing histidine kinase [Paucibacter sp. TC2R-5]|uniref:sensor histidine kinase n=1 Tax=Paucibacter sp. TC2R-5 TaxID=2893555 RepID=UPI0021E3A227|nr:HAMP domain-containing sensor histidine kinase [Paucibacter sp. TC2R-5]MCV2357441.1 HAMP domain-containing histidine kinase [Paucibacter sp. TC2R-5]